VIEGVEVSTDHWIGGERVASADAFEDVSPIDESVIAEVARGGAVEADRAVEAARRGAGTWGRTSPKERAEVLHRIADLVEERVPQLAAVETRDNGSLLRSMRNSVMPRVARNFRFFADQLMELDESFEMNGFESRTEWDPSGVTVVITPWNAPLMLATWRVAPALAAGNSLVLKPPEWAPLTASMLADIAREAGLPDGAFNVVQGIGEEAGAALVSHPLIRRVSFTGSTETARHIGTAAARNIVPFTAELGGKNPLIVFEDADLDAAAAKAAGQYDDAGQVCLSGTRLLVQESVAGEFLERFHASVDAHVLGDPREDATTISPLIHPDHLARVDGFVERARQDGQRIVRGGRRAGGLFYEPTLIVPTSNDAEIVQNEVFGPVLTIQTFADEDEAIALANSTRYGLSGIVYTGSMGRADRVGRAVRAGTVWVNTFLVRDLTAPFGGVGQSGIGREGGDYALDFYSDLKTLQILDGSVS
jgi:betaine-aldehyde dehydrogenase/5-carboxymethyl-2-hydroxymuconic-semialdehyde dehydrogenase